MNDKKVINDYKLWEDICFYETYKDILSYDSYINRLVSKYELTKEEIIKKIKEVKEKSQKRIQKHLEREKEYPNLFKSSSKEETTKIIIENQKRREEINNELFDESQPTINKIKSLGLSRKK